MTTTPSLASSSALSNVYSEHAVREDLVDKDIENLPEENNDQNRLVTFSPNDPLNPRNFSKARKWFITAFGGLLCFSVAVGSSMPTGALENAQEQLHVGPVAINLSITLFVVGFGVGPMLFAPLSEIMGRYPIYCITAFLYFIFNLPCALATNLATLLAARMIAGIAASAPMCNVGGTLSDIWAPHEKGFPMAIFSSLIFIGPSLGPLIGGFVAVGTNDGFHNTYWVLFAFTGIVFIMTLFTGETLAPVILEKKAKHLRKQTGDSKWHVAHKRPSLLPMLKASIIRPFALLAQEPILIFMSLYLCLVYSLLYILFFAFPIVFGQGHGFNSGEVGLTFLSLVIGIILAMIYVWFVQEPWYHKQCQKRGYNTPEDRLPLMIVGAPILPAALFIFAWTSMPNVHWAGALISGIPLGASFVMLYISANSYIVDCFPSAAASALAAKTLARSLCGAAAPLYVNQMYKAMSNQWASSLLAFVALAMIPIPLFFYKYGPGIRERSSNAESGDVTKAKEKVIGDEKS